MGTNSENRVLNAELVTRMWDGDDGFKPYSISSYLVRNVATAPSESVWQWDQPYVGDCEELKIRTLDGSTTNNIYCSNAKAAGFQECNYNHRFETELDFVKRMCEARSDCGGVFDYSSVGGLRMCTTTPGTFTKNGGHKVWPLKRAGGTELAKFTERLGNGGCSGRNEICTSTRLPCKTATTRDMCAKLCLADPTCISIEWEPQASSCQLSRTCYDADKTTGTSPWEMWRKREANLAKVLKAGARCKISATQEVSLGYQYSAVGCADKCRATDGCIYFIFGTNEKAGECWQQIVYANDCGNSGFDTPALYDFYMLHEEYIDRTTLNLQEVKVFDVAGSTNAMQIANVTQSSTQASTGLVLGKHGFGPELTVDDNEYSIDGTSRTATGDVAPWLVFDFGEVIDIARIQVTNRADCCKDRAAGAVVAVTSDLEGTDVLWGSVLDGVDDAYTLFPEVTQRDNATDAAKGQAMFDKSDFPVLEVISLSGTDLNRLQDDTFANLNGEKIATLDISEPTVSADGSNNIDPDLAVNFAGFTRPLAAMLWYSNTCPPGFYSTSEASARDDVALCARCPDGTYKPESGGLIDACTVCAAGTIDDDADPVTRCIVPPKFRTSTEARKQYSGLIIDIFVNETFEINGPGTNYTALFENAHNDDYAMIAYQLSYGAKGPPGRVLVDSNTGDMLGKPDNAGTYEVHLNAVDSGGFETAVQIVTVQATVRPDFKVVDDWDPQQAMKSSLPGKHYLGATISVPGPGIPLKDLFENPFDGNYDKIIFKLAFAESSQKCNVNKEAYRPGQFLVDTSNGQILGTTDTEGCFEMQLLGSDGTADVQVAVWIFNVDKRMPFTVTSFMRVDNPNATSIVSEFPTYYAVGETYRFASVQTIETDGLTSEQKETIGYTLNADAPPGFLINTKTGYIQGQPMEPGVWALELRAIATVNSAQEEALVQKIRVEAKYRDVEIPEFGPFNKPCVEGHGLPLDEPQRLNVNYEFDEEYECKCNPGFKGQNCEERECDKDEISAGTSCEKCLLGTISNTTHCLVAAKQGNVYTSLCPVPESGTCACTADGIVTDPESGQIGRPETVTVSCVGLDYPLLYPMPNEVTVLELRDVDPKLDPRLIYSILPDNVQYIGKVVVSSGAFLDGRNETFGGAAAALASGTRLLTGTAESAEIQKLPTCVALDDDAIDGLPPVTICSNASSANECKLCNVGEYMPSDASGNGGVQECAKCSAGGFYAEDKGRVGAYSHCDGACSRCPVGTFSPTPGATSRDECQVCPRGTDTNVTADYRACPCLPNFDRKDRYGECTSCIGNPGLICTGDARELVRGYWWTFGDENEDGGDSQLAFNYSEFSKNLRLSPAHDSYKPDYETFSSALPTPYECPNKDMCLGGFNAECAEGASGPLCAVCKANYTKANRICRPCPEKKGASLAIAFILFIVIIVAIVLLVRTNAQSLTTELESSNKKAILALAKEEDGGKADDDKVSDARWFECRFMSVLKIVLGHTQVTSLMVSTYIVKWPLAYEKLTAAFEATTSGPVTIARPECISPNLRFSAHGLMLFSTLGSAVFIVLIGIYFVVQQKKKDPPSLYCPAHTCKRAGCVNNKASGDTFCGGSKGCINDNLDTPAESAGLLTDPAPTICTHVSATKLHNGQPRKCKQPVVPSGRKKLVAVCILTVSLVFFLFYPLITTSTVQVLAPCHTLCVDAGSDVQCSKYLRADYSVDCESSKHKANYGWAMFCFIILGIGAPALVMWQLRRRMAPLHHRAIRSKYRKRMVMYVKDDGELDSNEKDELRTEFRTSGITLEEHDKLHLEVVAEYQASQAGGGDPSRFADPEDTSMASDPILLGMSFFSTPYKPQYYYWETVDLMRKLFVTSIVVFIEPGTTKQLLAGILFAAVGWGITAYAIPYAFQIENKLQQLSLGSITFTLILIAIDTSSSAPTMENGGSSSSFTEEASNAGIAFGLVISAIAIYVATAVLLYVNVKLGDVGKNMGSNLKSGIARSGSILRRGSLKGKSNAAAASSKPKFSRRLSTIDRGAIESLSMDTVGGGNGKSNVTTSDDGVISFQTQVSETAFDDDDVYGDVDVPGDVENYVAPDGDDATKTSTEKDQKELSGKKKKKGSKKEKKGSKKEKKGSKKEKKKKETKDGAKSNGQQENLGGPNDSVVVVIDPENNAAGLQESNLDEIGSSSSESEAENEYLDVVPTATAELASTADLNGFDA